MPAPSRSPSKALKSGLPLEHVPLDLLRTTLGWGEASAQTISDLAAADLTHEDVEAKAAVRVLGRETTE